MPDWLKELLPYISTIAAGVIGYFAGRDRKTIAALNARLGHLGDLLEESRRRESKIESAHKYAERHCKEYEERAAIEADVRMRNAEIIAGLHADVSRLEKHVADYPCLVRYASVYRYAFPEDGEDKVFFCLTCLEEDKVIQKLEPPRVDANFRFGYCPRHRTTY